MNLLVAWTAVLSVVVGWLTTCFVAAVGLRALGFQRELVELASRVGDPMFALYWFFLLPAFGAYSVFAIRFVLRRGRRAVWIVPAIPSVGVLAASAASWIVLGRFTVYGSGLCVGTLCLAVGATAVALGSLRERELGSRTELTRARSVATATRTVEVSAPTTPWRLRRR